MNIKGYIMQRMITEKSALRRTKKIGTANLFLEINGKNAEYVSYKMTISRYMQVSNTTLANAYKKRYHIVLKTLPNFFLDN